MRHGFQEKLLTEARDLVSYAADLSRQHSGHADPAFIKGYLARHQEQARESLNLKHPTVRDVKSLRLAELALAVADHDAGGSELAFQNVLSGLEPDGRAFLLSQHMAMHVRGAKDYLAPHVRNRFIEMADAYQVDPAEFSARLAKVAITSAPAPMH